MAENTSKGKGRKIGRDKNKCTQYKTAHTREKNKVKRVLKSNGRVEAEAYAKKHGLTHYLATL